MDKQHVLIVEDDTSFGIMLSKWFDKKGYVADLSSCVVDAQEKLSSKKYDLILTDLRLPDGDGIVLLTWIKEQDIHAPVIIMTSYAEVQTAVSAIKIGAFDFLEKPINPSILKDKVTQALRQELPSVNPLKTVVAKKEDESSSSQIVYGKSSVAQAMFDDIRMVAPTKMAVLITGESGTGKEYVARMIHEHSRRKEAPFIALDCGSLSRELAPSELFGHLKGSFTSAIADKKGVFEMAGGGTVFLDEVGNLSYDVQIQLLRVLQEFKIRPVGAANDIQVDIRIIVATNEDLKKAIAEGRFREDLFHRLNEFCVVVPPLRERIEDLPYFVTHFIETANQELEKKVAGYSEEVLPILTHYPWSGNLRELKNVIRRAVLFTKMTEITKDSLPDFVFKTNNQEESAASLFFIEDERARIEEALALTSGNKAAAARLLKVDRKTLYNKMHQYGMDLTKGD